MVTSKTDWINNQTIYVSATPADYELKKTEGVFVEQVIRPTGLLDPKIEIRPSNDQIDDLIDELYTWINPATYVLDPRLAGNPAAEGLKEYLMLRDKVIADTKKLPGGYSDTSFRRANKLAPYRTLLRNKIKAILVTKPEFLLVFLQYSVSLQLLFSTLILLIKCKQLHSLKI